MHAADNGTETADGRAVAVAVGRRRPMTDSRAWLWSRKAAGMRPGPEATAVLLERLGLAEPAWRALHVAGSNGKGTAAALLAIALGERGASTGLFTSPHVARVEERVRLDGRVVSAHTFDRALALVERAAEGEGFETRVPPSCVDGAPGPRVFVSRGMVGEALLPTFYEATLLVACVCFAERGVEWVVLETGLGGRLDATRALDAEGALVTALALEHTDVLGETLAAIAAEKAAIARPGQPLVVRHVADADARAAILEVADAADAGVTWVHPEMETVLIDDGIPLRDAADLCDALAEVGHGPRTMRGEAAMLAHQLLVEVLADDGEDAASLVAPVAEAALGLRWPARMQWIEVDGIEVLVDAAHNPSGLTRLAGELRGQDPLDGLLFGSSPQSDEDAWRAAMALLLQRLRPGAQVILAEARHGRHAAWSAEALALELRALGAMVTVREPVDPGGAAGHLRLVARPGERWLSCGSLYLQGELLSHLGRDRDEDLAIIAKSN